MFLVLQSWGLSTVPPSTHDTAKKKKSLEVLSRKTKIRQVSSQKQANSKTEVTCIAHHPDNLRVIYGFSCKTMCIKILKILGCVLPHSDILTKSTWYLLMCKSQLHTVMGCVSPVVSCPALAAHVTLEQCFLSFHTTAISNHLRNFPKS